MEKFGPGPLGQRRPRSACAFAQSDEGFRCLLQNYFILTITCLLIISKVPDKRATLQANLALR